VIQFHKIEATGNDFILFDQLGEDAPKVLLPEFVSRLCHRRFGIGSDGVLAIAPDDGGWRLRMWNPDGSESEMCGNALRAVAEFLQPERSVRIHIGGRSVLVEREDGEWATRMGVPNWEHFPEARLTLDAQTGDTVGFENPHVVVCVADLDSIRVNEDGPRWEHHPAAPNRTNVHFVQTLGPDAVKVLTWERGAGATWACGSGACAVAAVVRRQLDMRDPLKIRMPGGDLTVRWEGEEAILVASARVVFEGVIRCQIGAA
jgi:diaminopimelate epimerase